MHFDVSELLNAKKQELNVVKPLEKCPDKNAKLSFRLTAYMREEVQPDAVSGKSSGSIPVEQSRINQSSIQMTPSFKKKGDTRSVESSEPPKSDRVPAVSKTTKERLRLEEENKRLKEEMRELKELEFENNTLRRRYEEGEKKARAYY